jgi:protein-S-isoprenylcysteine O-methyltransferase Ste14
LQLGLAIWGWGGFAPFFAHPALQALAAITILLTIVACFTEAHISPGEKEDRGNRWALYSLILISLVHAYLPALTDRLDFWTIDGDATRWIGGVIFTVGGVVRLIPVFVLGKRFSGLVALQKDHHLVTTGVYGIIRHPSYLGLVLGALGWALAFRSGVGVLTTVILLVPLVGRIRAEEAFLSANFGAEYDAYRARTWRMIPGIY